ncbi:Gfo/Idh/MocA family oxidoreductase [bacterium]|nr:Gfo/Idh/MocA family oxidoreductase [bacterium]
MNRKLRVGVVGVGGISSEHHLPHWKSSPHVELVALCDIDSDRLQKQAAKHGLKETYTDWHELIERVDLDLIDIATPNEMHAPIAMAALDLSKHVLCEKPMATSAVDAKRMLDLAEQRGRKLQINHHFRFDRTFRDLVAFSSPADLGVPYFAHARWHRRRRVPTAPTFLQSSLSGGGPMLDLGVHVIDLAMMLMGFPKPVSVSASSGTHLARRSDLGGDWGDWDPLAFEVEDFAVALFRFQTGATLFVETSWLGFHDKPEEWFVRVLGTKGGLHWPEGLVVQESNKIPRTTHLTGSATRSPYEQSVHGFVEAIIHDQKVPIPPGESLEVVRMVEAAYISARVGREVPIDDVD